MKTTNMKNITKSALNLTLCLSVALLTAFKLYTKFCI